MPIMCLMRLLLQWERIPQQARDYRCVVSDGDECQVGHREAGSGGVAAEGKLVLASGIKEGPLTW